MQRYVWDRWLNLTSTKKDYLQNKYHTSRNNTENIASKCWQSFGGISQKMDHTLRCMIGQLGAVCGSMICVEQVHREAALLPSQSWAFPQQTQTCQSWAQPYLLLHEVHDVFEVQVIIVVHDALPNIFVQQLHSLQKREISVCVYVVSGHR